MTSRSVTLARHARVLVFDFIINTLLTIVEFVAAIISGSIAIRGDGFQNLTDSLVLSVAFIGERIATQSGRSRRATRLVYRRIQVTNALILISLSLYIGYAATERLLHPKIVNGVLVLAIGIGSIAINFWAALLLRSFRKDTATEAPYIGLLFSGVSGVGVTVAGICAVLGRNVWIDGAIGACIAVLLFARSSRMLLRTTRSYRLD